MRLAFSAMARTLRAEDEDAAYEDEELRRCGLPRAAPYTAPTKRTEGQA